MRSPPRPLPLLFALVVLLVIVVPGCQTGSQARTVAADEVVTRVDAAIESDVRRGIQLLAVDDPEFDAEVASLAADTFFMAVASGQRWQISSIALPRWPSIRSYAERGFEIEIRKGTLVVGTAASLIKQLDQFERLITRVSEGAVPPAADEIEGSTSSSLLWPSLVHS